MQFSLTEPNLSPESIQLMLMFIRQAMVPYVDWFIGIAKTLLPVLFALELVREALKIAQGKEHNLVMLFAKFFTVTVLLASFAGHGGTSFAGNRFQLGLHDNFVRIPFAAIETFYKVSDAKIKEVEDYRKLILQGQDGLTVVAYDVFTTIAKINPVNLMSKLLYFLSNLGVLIVFLSAYVAYSLMLLVGPLATVCLISPELLFVFKTWVKSIISYVIVFIVICLALDASMGFQVTAIKMAHGETDLGFWNSTKVTLYMAVISFGFFYAALKIGPILFKAGGDGKSIIGGK